MFKKIAVTNRLLCKRDFLEQIEKIARSQVSAILLREKDLPEYEYIELAKKVIARCNVYSVPCILHNFEHAADTLHHSSLHMPIWKIRENQNICKKYDTVGASIHSVEEAIEAEKLGVSYVIAGHIFQTDCKKGLEPRGLSFLQQVASSVSIPVYAIGGIKESNINAAIEAGAKGVCMMSEFMSME